MNPSIHEPTRVLAMLVGDVYREPFARIKYGYFLDAFRQRFSVVDAFDASLKGLLRYWNALSVLHPDTRTWQERFYKNVRAFELRSTLAAQRIQAGIRQADVSLQIGCLFDSTYEGSLLPNLIYTDYTSALSARKRETGRSPFDGAARERWTALESRAYQSAFHIFARAGYVRDSLCQDYGISNDKVTVVGGGVNLPSLPEKMSALNGDPPTAFFIGKEFHRKGGDLLLQAFARARRKYPSARLIVLTGDKISSTLPQEGVTIMSPTWNRTEIEALYRKVDLFVLPSRQETWGDVLLEAMAFGLPCVGVTGEAMHEIIVDGATGFVVEPNDVESLSLALASLFGNPLLRRKLGQAGRRRVEKQFLWSQVVERMAPAIEQAAIHRYDAEAAAPRR